ncbi:MAG: Mannose-phosphate guanylyltransferase, partial [Verrucomicrobia bacterium]|nr:Mannose-phosphate guanylyltransferase [Verrucomicrobiota bacterium]
MGSGFRTNNGRRANVELSTLNARPVVRRFPFLRGAFDATVGGVSEISHAYVFIMAGGSGERFWPMSRQRQPKHLLKLVSERTLVEEAVRRVEGVVSAAHVFVLTNVAQLEATRAALAGVLPSSQIVAEPAKRDTAAAAALATALVRARDPKAVLALLPADAFIRDTAAFARQLRAAL